MISCTEFIPAYNELFKYLEEVGGVDAVERFWEGISDDFLWNLRKLVEEKGTWGMWEYWTHTLNEEGADFSMHCEDDLFTIEMRACPSVAKLRNSCVTPYRRYCHHCDTLYRRVIEPFGFTYNIDFIDQEAGVCKVTVKQMDTSV